MHENSNYSEKVLIIHLVSNGDCLYTTAIARYIKKLYPNCHLTWIISNLCSQILINNPDVDTVQVVQIRNVKEGLFNGWYSLIDQLKSEGVFGQYSKVYHTQFFPENLHNYDGTIRSSLLRVFPNFKAINVQPALSLTNVEVENVHTFCRKNKISHFRKVVLFECSPGSGQSYVNPEFALELSHRLVSLENDMIIILSTHLPLQTNHNRIIAGNELSFRENAELAAYCHLLIGSSSGITWLSTSDWLKKQLPMIQLLKKAPGISFASVVYDFDYWGLDSSQVTEIFNPDLEQIINCVRLFFQKGMGACKERYHEKITPDPFYIKDYFNMLAKKRKIKPLIGLFKNFYDRNGFSLRLVAAFLYIILQGIIKIPITLISGNRSIIK